MVREKSQALVNPASTGNWTNGPKLSELRAARLTGPNASLVYDGECGQPQPWHALIARTGGAPG